MDLYKKFSVTGTCIPERHYMVDLSGKLGENIGNGGSRGILYHKPAKTIRKDDPFVFALEEAD